MPKRQASESRLSLLVLIALASAVPFLPALHNGFVNWDDVQNFLENPYYRGLGWTQLKWMFTTLFPPPYQPLSWLTFGADYCLWGLDPMGYHLTNIALHAANAVLFFFIGVRILAAAQGLEENAPGLRWAAALAALLFAVHPLRVESVAWATERRDVLSGFFYLLTILSYLRLGRTPASPRRLALPLGLYLLSLLAKGMGVTLPLALLILDVYPFRRLPGDPRRWLEPEARSYLWEKLPFLGLAVVFALIGVVSQQKGGAIASVESMGLAARLAQCLYGLAFYFRKTFWPTALSPLYLRPTPFVPTAPPFLLSAAFVCALTIGAISVRRRWPAFTAACAYYAATLLPVLGLFPLGALLVADRYSYLSCLAWPLLVAGAVLRPRKRICEIALWGAAGAALGLLGMMTWRQTLVWRDSSRLWRHALALDPANSVGDKNLAIVLFNDGRLPEAIEECEKALGLAPGYADAHTLLAQILMAQGRTREAGEHYAAALIAVPNDASTHYNLGVALYRQGRWQEAIPHYRRALELDPKANNARVNLGSALVAGGQWEQAIDAYRQALELDPGNAGAHDSLGVALVVVGRFDEALAQVDRALALSPNDPRILKDRSWITEYVRKRRRSN